MTCILYSNKSGWYNIIYYIHIISTIRLYVQPWCFSKPALESMGVSALCRRASRLWKTPKILAASATPRKPWRPFANFLEKFWKSRICREKTKTTQKLKEKTCLCWVHLSNDSLSPSFLFWVHLHDAVHLKRDMCTVHCCCFFLIRLWTC